MASRTRSTWASLWVCAVMRSCGSGSALELWIRSLARPGSFRVRLYYGFTPYVRGAFGRLVTGVVAIFVCARRDDLLRPSGSPSLYFIRNKEYATYLYLTALCMAALFSTFPAPPDARCRLKVWHRAVSFHTVDKIR